MYSIRPVMADIFANRRERLRQLIEERFGGNRTALVRAAGLNPSYVSRFTEIFGERSNLGDRAAGRIEQGLGLPVGWLDGEPSHGASKIPYKGRMGPPRKVQLHAVEELLAAGYTQKEAARQLGVHESTVSHALKRERKSKRPQRVAA